MSLGFINSSSSDTSSLGTLVTDSSQSYGFTWVNRVSQKVYIRWKKYSILDQRHVSFSYESNFTITPSHQYEIIALIDAIINIPRYVTSSFNEKIETCDKFNTYYEPGLACVFSIKTNASNISTRYFKAEFFSNGATKKTSILNINDTTFNVDKIYQLWSGGYLLVVHLKTDNSLIGYIYDIQGKFSNSWDSPSLPENLKIFIDHFPNITFSTRELVITFYNQISLSIENISIYQDSSAGPIPRLYYNAQNNGYKFYISPDSKMISISVLKSTFVSPQSEYYLVMDNNFVKDLIHEEPLLGANWNFSTDSEYALARLNMNESYYFNILSKNDKSDYLNQLKNELAHSVQIDPSNIVAKGQYQWDNNANHLQILLKFEILP
ncbi:hypothetical protein F8M41_014653 [Gigaspora margarita]|uniref:Uncharacterized protein n=1 Tax=Gigaspora margarita TaxID=4874 RepID=A0A8H4ENX4_GIGMA|nr:hypothetical protein F8M41_014653 [Gigaspora margarita]